MYSASKRWSIPGLGEFRLGFDRVCIVSRTPVGPLKIRLPVKTLASVSHSFNVTTYKGPNPKLRSVITIVCAQDHRPLQILAELKAVLGDHSVVDVEIAFDLVGGAPCSAPEGLLVLVGQIVKLRHQRRHLRVEHHQDRTPPPGCTSGPTFYFEDRRSSVKLKAYVRQRKLPGGGFGDEHVRLEWTLSRKPAVVRHLGGNKIEHLLTADLGKFLERNLRLEQIDHVELGYLFAGIPARRRQKLQNPPASNSPLNQLRNPDYRARRGAFLLLRRLANREEIRFADPGQALWVCQNSPAQIRGYLKELRDGARPRRGRPENIKPRRMPITDYKIERCFRRIKPVPV